MNAPLRPPAIFTDDEFEAMARSGALAKLGRFELRGGVIVRMSPIHLPHARVRLALTIALTGAIKGLPQFNVLDEVTVRLGGGFQPTSDIVLWAPVGDPMGLDGPLPGEMVKLVIEIANSSLADDLGDKLASYAGAGVPEYWVVDVKARVIFQHAAPGTDGYGERETLRFGERAGCLTLPDVAVETAALAG
ncbi:MAG: Uma2 family endonuclease [Pseudomonadota bacterium]